MAQRDLRDLQRQVDALSREEQVELATYLLSKGKGRHLEHAANGAEVMKFFGKIDFKGHPLEIQHQMRAEWPS